MKIPHSRGGKFEVFEWPHLQTNSLTNIRMQREKTKNISECRERTIFFSQNAEREQYVSLRMQRERERNIFLSLHSDKSAPIIVAVHELVQSERKLDKLRSALRMPG